MKIRSVTYFSNPGYPIKKEIMDLASDFIGKAKPAYEDGGFEVQTIRFAMPAFPTVVPNCSLSVVLEYVKRLEKHLTGMGFDYLSIGPAIPEVPNSYQLIPDLIAETENCFASGIIASQKSGISIPAIKACAEIIKRLSPIDPNGFANLYFAALANVRSGAPFFPAAFHEGDTPVFAIATEAADLAVNAFSKAETLTEAQRLLKQSLEAKSKALVSISKKINLKFGGIDFSLAPFPTFEKSLGTAIERLGIPGVGRHGSLTASAIIADTIDKAEFPHTGFSGMMLPVLEDATLAARAAEGILSIKDMLLYSAVCGTGLDTVPLPGDVDIEALSALLLDLGTLAMRLDKPLTARLMPIPGKKAGDPTNFDFPFFANSRVMPLEAEKLNGHLAGDESFNIGPRHQNLISK